jgi:hypothetical protein
MTNCEATLKSCEGGAFVCTPQRPCNHTYLGGRHETLEGSKCSAAAAFTPELAEHLARLIDAGVRARRERGPPRPPRPRDAAPVDVREILRDAAKEADSRGAERGAASQTYLERHGESTYLQRMEALLQKAGIGDPPPQSSSPLPLAASRSPSAQASMCSSCSYIGADPEAEAEAEVGAEAEAETWVEAEAEAEAEAETGVGAEAEAEAEAEGSHLGRRSSLSFEDLIRRGGTPLPAGDHHEEWMDEEGW